MALCSDLTELWLRQEDFFIDIAAVGQMSRYTLPASMSWDVIFCDHRLCRFKVPNQLPDWNNSLLFFTASACTCVFIPNTVSVLNLAVNTTFNRSLCGFCRNLKHLCCSLQAVSCLNERYFLAKNPDDSKQYSWLNSALDPNLEMTKKRTYWFILRGHVIQSCIGLTKIPHWPNTEMLNGSNHQRMIDVT